MAVSLLCQKLLSEELRDLCLSFATGFTRCSEPELGRKRAGESLSACAGQFVSRGDARAGDRQGRKPFKSGCGFVAPGQTSRPPKPCCPLAWGMVCAEVAHLAPAAGQLPEQSCLGRSRWAAVWPHSSLCSHVKELPTGIAAREVLSSDLSSHLVSSSWCLSFPNCINQLGTNSSP